MPKVGEEHREQRRRTILDAALACFDRRGLHGTTMQDIVAESGLSAGAIYTYFDSKDAIIAAIAADRHARERELLEAALAATTARRIARVRRHVLRLAHGPRRATAPPGQRLRLGRSAAQPGGRGDRDGGRRADRRRVGARRSRERDGRFPAARRPGGFLRAVLALIQGFVLQQAWDPDRGRRRLPSHRRAMIDGLLPGLPADRRDRDPTDGPVLERFLHSSQPALTGHRHCVPMHDVHRDQRMHPARLPRRPSPPVVDIVVPVYNEERALAPSIERLHAYLAERFPFSWRITIVDNASTDGTWLTATPPGRASSRTSTARHLDRKGRGLALRTAWIGVRRRRSSPTWTSTSRPTSTRSSRSWPRSCPATPTSRSAPGSRPGRRWRGHRSARSSPAPTT